MKTKPEQTEPEKRINALTIFEMIENLQCELRDYQQITLNKQKSYALKIGLIELKRHTENLKLTLEDLMQHVKDWEGLE